MIQHSDIMDLAGSYCYPGRNWTSQIYKRMHLNCCLGLAELGPWKQRKTQVNGCRVKSIQRLFQFNGNCIITVKLLRHTYQNVPKVLKDAPVPALIGIRESGPGNVTTKPNVVEFLLMGIQASFNVPQTFTTG